MVISRVGRLISSEIMWFRSSSAAEDSLLLRSYPGCQHNHDRLFIYRERIDLCTMGWLLSLVRNSDAGRCVRLRFDHGSIAIVVPTTPFSFLLPVRLTEQRNSNDYHGS